MVNAQIGQSHWLFISANKWKEKGVWKNREKSGFTTYPSWKFPILPFVSLEFISFFPSSDSFSQQTAQRHEVFITTMERTNGVLVQFFGNSFFISSCFSVLQEAWLLPHSFVSQHYRRIPRTGEEMFSGRCEPEVAKGRTHYKKKEEELNGNVEDCREHVDVRWID